MRSIASSFASICSTRTIPVTNARAIRARYFQTQCRLQRSREGNSSILKDKTQPGSAARDEGDRANGNSRDTGPDGSVAWARPDAQSFGSSSFKSGDGSNTALDGSVASAAPEARYIDEGSVKNVATRDRRPKARTDDAKAEQVADAQNAPTPLRERRSSKEAKRTQEEMSDKTPEKNQKQTSSFFRLRKRPGEWVFKRRIIHRFDSGRVPKYFKAYLTKYPSTWIPSTATRPLLLTFDAFGTLFEPRRPIESQYVELAANYDIELEESDVLESFKSTFAEFSAAYPNYGKSSGTNPEAWWSHVIHGTLRPLIPEDQDVPPELLRDLYDRFATQDGYTLFADVDGLLAVLGTSRSEMDWPPQRTLLGVNTNSDPRILSILKSFGVSVTPSLFPPRYSPPNARIGRINFGPADFGFATISYNVGFEKPDKNMYDASLRDAQYMLDRLARIASTNRTYSRLLRDIRQEFHAMHVGDDLEKDAIASIKCGWDGVLLDRSQKQQLTERHVEIELTPDDYIYHREPAAALADGAPITKALAIPVINSLYGLRHLVNKTRLEHFNHKTKRYEPTQAPVYLDESRAMERAFQGQRRLWRRLSGRRLVAHPLQTKNNPLAMYI